MFFFGLDSGTSSIQLYRCWSSVSSIPDMVQFVLSKVNSPLLPPFFALPIDQRTFSPKVLLLLLWMPVLMWLLVFLFFFLLMGLEWMTFEPGMFVFVFVLPIIH